MMQTVATYLMELGDEGDPASTLDGYRAEALEVVESWLKAKGAAPESTSTGTYQAIDGSAATYHRKSAHDGDRRWDLLVLEETTETGRIFRTSISVTRGSSSVAVFVTMQVGTTGGNLTRVNVHPRCPAIVRDILALPGKWRHGRSPLLEETLPIIGKTQGDYLAEMLRNESRAIPYVVVSLSTKREQQEQISDELAYELAGLANVVTVDDEASWALTERLGKTFSVFDDGIRIYWPQVDAVEDQPHKHQLWTSSKLEAMQARSSWLFRNSISRILMEASSASISRPQEIDEIRNAEANEKYAVLVSRSKELEQLKSKAKSLAEYEELADSYASENDLLREQVDLRDARIVELEDELESATHERSTLLFRLEQASASRSESDDAPSSTEDEEPAGDAPTAGEVRYYKKVGSSRKHDFLERVGGCNHSAWQSSNSADKARKGFERLGLPNWKRLQHCGTCTGGGMWRIEW